MAKEAVKIQEGATFDHTLLGAVANGDVIDFATRIGVCYDDGITGDTIAVAIEGVFEITALTSDTVAEGVDLYFDTGARVVTTTVGTNIPAGMAVSVKAGAVTGSVLVKIG